MDNSEAFNHAARVQRGLLSTKSEVRVTFSSELPGWVRWVPTCKIAERTSTVLSLRDCRIAVSLRPVLSVRDLD